MRNMSSPLVSAEEMQRATAEVGTVELEPFRDFEFDLEHQRLRCAGYSVAEVGELLALYREHMRKMVEFGQAQAQNLSETSRLDL